MISDEINISVSLADCDMLHPTIWFYLDMPHRFFIIMMIYISTENLSVDGIESTRVAVQSRCQRILQTESGREYGGWFFTDVHDRRWHDQLPGWAIRQHQFLTCISLSITMSMVCTVRFFPSESNEYGEYFHSLSACRPVFYFSDSNLFRISNFMSKFCAVCQLKREKKQATMYHIIM
mgnify:CR=1 FL=1